MDAPKRILGRRCSPYSADRLRQRALKAARREGLPDVAATAFVARAAAGSWHEAERQRAQAAQPPRAC